MITRKIEFTESLYGSTYKVVRQCKCCESSNWYNLTATDHLLCLECGNQEEV